MPRTKPDPVAEAALDALVWLFAAPGDLLAASAVGSANVLRRLFDWGVLREAGALDRVICDACDRRHFARVEREPECGSFSWICPDAGRVPTTADRVRKVRFDRTGLVSALAAGLTRRGTAAPLDDTGHLWRLGRLLEGPRRIDLLLSARGSEPQTMEKWRRAAATLGPLDLAVVLCAEPVTVGAIPFPGGRATPLAELLSLGPEGHPELDDDELKRLIASWSPSMAVGGRPSGVGATAQVIEHCIRLGLVSGINEAAPSLIAAHWSEVHPNVTAPARSTLKDHLNRLRQKAANRSALT